VCRDRTTRGPGQHQPGDRTAGREGTEVTFGWHVDLIVDGLDTDMAAGVVSYVCSAEDCGVVRIAARVLVPVVADRVLGQLRTAAAPDLLLAIAHRRGAELVSPDTASAASWWASADPAAQKEPLGLLVDHIVVKPVDGPGCGVGERLSMAWRWLG
jgi:hypothetical protein